MNGSHHGMYAFLQALKSLDDLQFVRHHHHARHCSHIQVGIMGFRLAFTFETRNCTSTPLDCSSSHSCASRAYHDGTGKRLSIAAPILQSGGFGLGFFTCSTVFQPRMAPLKHKQMWQIGKTTLSSQSVISSTSSKHRLQVQKRSQ